MSYRKALVLVLMFTGFLVYPRHSRAQAPLPHETMARKQSPVRALEGDVVVFKQENPLEGTLRWSIGGRQLCVGSTCEVDTSTLRAGTHRLVLRQVKEAAEQRSEVLIHVLPRPSIDRMGSNRIQVPLGLLAELNPIAVTWQTELITGIGFYRHPKGLRQVVDDALPIEWAGSLESGVSSVVRFGKPKVLEGFVLPNTVLFLKTNSEGTPSLELSKGLIRLRNLTQSNPPRLSISGIEWVIQGDAESDLVVEYLAGSKPTVRVTALRGTAKVSGGKEPIVVPTGGQGVWHADIAGLTVTRPKAFRLRAVILATTPELARLDQARVTQRHWGRLNNVPMSEEEWDGLLAGGDAMGVVEGIALLADSQRNDPRVALVEGEALARIFLLDEALNSFRRGEQQLPKEKIPDRFYGAWGLALLWEEKWQAAEGRFREAERVGKKPAPIWKYYRGVAAQRQGKKLAAHRAFTSVTWDPESPPEVQASAAQFISYLEDQSLHRGAFALGVLRDTNLLHDDQEKAMGTAFVYNGRYQYGLFTESEGRGTAAVKLDGIGYQSHEYVDAGHAHMEGDLLLEFAIPSKDGVESQDHFFGGLRLGTMTFVGARAYDYIALRTGISSAFPTVQIPLSVEAEHTLGLDPKNGDVFPSDPLFHGKMGPMNHSFAAHSLRLQGNKKIREDIEGSMAALVRKRWFYQGGDENGKFDSMTLGLEMAWSYRLRPWLPLQSKIQLDFEHFHRWPTTRRDTLFLGEGSVQWWLNAQWYVEGKVTYEARQSTAALHDQTASFIRKTAGLWGGFAF